jgi:hypothetical protein
VKKKKKKFSKKTPLFLPSEIRGSVWVFGNHRECGVEHLVDSIVFDGVVLSCAQIDHAKRRVIGVENLPQIAKEPFKRRRLHVEELQLVGGLSIRLRHVDAVLTKDEDGHRRREAAAEQREQQNKHPLRSSKKKRKKKKKKK